MDEHEYNRCESGIDSWDNNEKHGQVTSVIIQKTLPLGSVEISSVVEQNTLTTII